jgi:uncharacterized protein
MNRTEICVDCGNGIRLIRGRAMRTRDGVTLVSDHYIPAGNRPAPTLLMRQPYGRDIASTVVHAHPVWFARNGYNVVIQDVRGRGDSGGDFYPFRHESNDGYDAIQWVSGLPESTGQVGMYGFSYQGLTQLLAAAEQPPSLVAIAPAMTTGDLYHGWFYMGGMFRLAYSVSWATQMLRGDAIKKSLKRQSRELELAWSQLSSFYSRAPFSDLVHLQDEELPSYFTDWMTHDLPGEYWSQMDLSARYDRISVPALHIAGWYDFYTEGSINCYENLKSQGATEHARDNQYLIVGPWSHIPWDRHIGEQDFGANALLDTDQILLKWFNHWLKRDNSFTDEAKVRVFDLGKNSWRTCAVWAQLEPSPKKRDYYLHSGGKANSIKGNGSLSADKPELAENRDVVVIDPEVPVLAPGGTMAAAGPFRQNRIEGGNNVLVYRSAPLPEEVHVYGRPHIRLYISSSTNAHDVVAKLTRIDRDGQAWNICIGARRSQYHFSNKPLERDVPTLWEFDLEPTSCVFDVGERIGLEIAGTAFPLLDRSANDFSIPARDAQPFNWKRTTLQLLHQPEFPSALTLPLFA